MALRSNSEVSVLNSNHFRLKLNTTLMQFVLFFISVWWRIYWVFFYLICVSVAANSNWHKKRKVKKKKTYKINGSNQTIAVTIFYGVNNMVLLSFWSLLIESIVIFPYIKFQKKTTTKNSIKQNKKKTSKTCINQLH